jgi:hypothetical protein
MLGVGPKAGDRGFPKKLLLQNPKKWIPDGLIQDKFGRIWMFSQ